MKLSEFTKCLGTLGIENNFIKPLFPERTLSTKDKVLHLKNLALERWARGGESESSLFSRNSFNNL